MNELETKGITILYECEFGSDYIIVNYYNTNLKKIYSKKYTTLDAVEHDLQDRLPEMTNSELVEFFEMTKLDDFLFIIEPTKEDLKNIKVFKDDLYNSGKVVSIDGINYVIA